MSKEKKEQKNIIIKKIKRISGDGHHGGAWKVAYADFVTAMMAFFLLMWLVSSSSENTLQGIAEYFTPTEAISDKAGLGFDGGADPNMSDGISAMNASSDSLIYGSPSKGKRVDSARLPNSNSNSEKEQFVSIMNSIQKNQDIRSYSDNVHVDISDEGLRIQVMDSENRPIFKPNTSELEPFMDKILSVIGKIIKSQANYISISGHAATPELKDKDKLDLWNISSNRANVVRQFLVDKKLIDSAQMIKMLALADKEPFDLKNPQGPKNIRVSITLLNAESINKHQKSSPDNLKD